VSAKETPEATPDSVAVTALPFPIPFD
jgi:hypothetical protein